jgi:hypothetical protein
MPEKNGKRDTQRTEQGYEIPVPKRKSVMDLLGKAATKRSGAQEAERAGKPPKKPRDRGSRA